MSDEPKKECEGETPKASETPAPTGAGASAEEEEERPRITLDRYMSQRRRTSSWSWLHLVVLVFMLGALVMLIMYKDQCGRAVSGFIFMGSPDRGPPVKLKTEPAPPPPSQPTKP